MTDLFIAVWADSDECQKTLASRRLALVACTPRNSTSGSTADATGDGTSAATPRSSAPSCCRTMGTNICLTKLMRKTNYSSMKPCLFTGSHHGLQTCSPVPLFSRVPPCLSTPPVLSCTRGHIQSFRVEPTGTLTPIYASTHGCLAQTKVTVFQFFSSSLILDPSSPSRNIHPILCIFPVCSSPALFTTSP